MFQSAKHIWKVSNEEEFNKAALEVFRYQADEIEVYGRFVNQLGINPHRVKHYRDIPFLPVSFFKTHHLFPRGIADYDALFTSSGTTQTGNSKHCVLDTDIYRQSIINGFRRFYGDPSDYVILGLLPDYLEREGASLVYMVNYLMEQSCKAQSGFYLYEHDKLFEVLTEQEKAGQKTLLIGVTFALLDFLEKYRMNLNHTVVMETGGMKGRRKELVKEELHDILTRGFGTKRIHSEYGMTELLSQAYSKGENIFRCPPWMKMRMREVNDPFSYVDTGQTGGINIIDLANIHSCSFIATHDLGKMHEDGSFEVLGRFDNSDIRGCNLMVQ